MKSANGPLYDRSPAIVVWEMTHACALACTHCRAQAVPHRDPAELSTREAFDLVDAIARSGAHLLILSGGDPMMRDDIYKIVEHARHCNLHVAVAPSATGRLRDEALRRLVVAGASAISLSLDAPIREEHDRFRGVEGSFMRTITAIDQARTIGLEVQVNTTITRLNHEKIGALVPVLADLGIARWTAFFLVPMGRANIALMLDAQQTEAAFERLYQASQIAPFPISTTEAPSYRRFVAQKEPATPQRPSIGDGRGFAFVSHVGDIYPSGFLPIAVANVRSSSFGEVYRTNPLFTQLRRPSSFSGRCGTCEYNMLCGGSRARAFAVHGDAFASDPACAYDGTETANV